jgi:hypothetical protein
MNRFVLDTSIFTNPNVYRQFGDTTREAVRGFVKVAVRLNAEFYMPGSVYDELCKMKDLGEVAADFESVVRLRSPRKFDLDIPGELLYELITRYASASTRASRSPRRRPRPHSRPPTTPDSSSTRCAAATARRCARASWTARRTWTCCCSPTSWTAYWYPPTAGCANGPTRSGSPY